MALLAASCAFGSSQGTLVIQALKTLSYITSTTGAPFANGASAVAGAAGNLTTGQQGTVSSFSSATGYTASITSGASQINVVADASGGAAVANACRISGQQSAH